MDIIGMSLSASVLIIITVILRKLPVKIPSRIFVFCWLTAALRMLLPFEASEKINIFSAVPSVQESLSVNTSATFADIFLFVWLIGAAVIFAAVIIRHIITIRRFACALPFDLNSGFTLNDRIKIKLSDMTEVPFTYGIFRPVIIIPQSTVDNCPQNIKFILMHEGMHIRSFDTLKKLILVAAASLNWFNPLAWLMLFLADNDIERMCDEDVVNNDISIKKSYARAIIDCENIRFSPLIMRLSGGNLEKRILGIMNCKKCGTAEIILSMIIICTTFFCSALINFSTHIPISDDIVFEYVTYELPENVLTITSDDIELSDTIILNATIYDYPNTAQPTIAYSVDDEINPTIYYAYAFEYTDE